MCNLSEGIEARGVEKGREEEAKENVLQMHNIAKLSDEQIAEIVKRDVETIKEWLYGENK
ncbi:hypothetical protein [Terrisporobacter sp.]